MTRIDLRVQKVRTVPLCIGAGFVAMDIVEAEDLTFAAAGGSCGNVMALLAWMGWNAAPVARLGDDSAGRFVRQAFSDINVSTDYLSEEKGVQTPIVIQRFVETKDGERTHRFSLTCPECGGWLPRYRAATLKHAASVIEEVRAPKAYYFDRVSPSGLRLAEWAKREGSLVVFEPSSIGDERKFQQAVDLCDVLKYSHDRLGHVPDLTKVTSPRLVIETRGEDGLRVRWRGRWSVLPAFEAPHFVDAAGSGDWCSAALIHKIGEKGAAGLDSLNKPRLDHALRFGQALAAINCGYEGARGAMMVLTHAKLNKALAALSQKAAPELERELGAYLTPPADLCNACSVETGASKQKKKQSR